MPKCLRCGSCCIQYHGNNFANEEEIRRWIEEERFDILHYCYGWNEWCFWNFIENPKEVLEYLTEGINSDVWFNPETQEEIYLCPFLRKRRNREQFECSIHDTRPGVCREYFCDPKDMKKIVKKSFIENLREYRKKRRH